LIISANVHQINHRIITEVEQNYHLAASDGHRTIIGW